MGPLTFQARLWGLGEILNIQTEVNVAAQRRGRPAIDLLNGEEETRIRELIVARTWPLGWSGEEPVASYPMHQVFQDGSIQPDMLLSLREKINA